MRSLLPVWAALLAIVCAGPAFAQAKPDSPEASAPGVEAPVRMTLVWRSWGNRLQEWTLDRDGRGVFIDRDRPPVAFSITAGEFDRFREIFRPYEGVRFECRRVVTDGAYGSVVWSRPGRPDQSLNFDAGCVTGDAADVFERLERAEALLRTLRDR